MVKKLVILGGILLAILLSYSLYNKNVNSAQDMSYPAFLEAVKAEQVDSVILYNEGHSFRVILKDKVTQYKVPHPETENFTEYILMNDIKLSYESADPAIQGIRILSVLIFGGVIFLLIRNGNGNQPSMKDVNKEKAQSKTTFSNIAGNLEAKAMVDDIIRFIKNPEQYSKLGARMPKGLLFYGPPGTGKTLMAKAVAGEAGVPFYAMSGSDFVQMYVGVGASRIRTLFKKAKKSERAVIFIDEIDAIGKKRSRNLSASNDERDQTLNALLTEMSGFHDNSGIIVIGATNRLDTLDEALLRPGRFDRQIEIGLPDINSRKMILSLHAKGKPLSSDVNLDELAKTTVCFSGAMLENLMNESAIQAANEHKTMISSEHIDRAFYTIVAGAPKQDRSYIMEQDRVITAYHEAGHAMLTELLLPNRTISKVTIIPSVRGTGGFNLSIPKDSYYQSKQQIAAYIQMLLAGRAAEELIFGSDYITTGASDDLNKASSVVYDYVNKFGMDDEMGLFNISVLDNSQDPDMIQKCRSLLQENYAQTKSMIAENLSLLEAIAQELLNAETISGDDIKRLAADNAPN